MCTNSYLKITNLEITRKSIYNRTLDYSRVLTSYTASKKNKTKTFVYTYEWELKNKIII